MSVGRLAAMMVATAAITSGTITASPCTVDPSSVSQTVTFPSVTDVQLKQLADAGGVASSFPNQPFNILLTGCDSGISNVLVSFSGSSDTGIAADMSVLKNGGSASNVGVRIMDTAGTTALKFDGSNSQ